MSITQDQLAKLPKWAQDHIREIQRQRDVAVRSLNEAVNGGDDDRVWYTLYPCTGEESGPSWKKFKIPSNSVRMTLAPWFAEADVDITNRHFDHPQRISISFNHDIYALIPTSGNQICLEIRPAKRYAKLFGAKE